MRDFDIHSMPDLDEAVIWALELFRDAEIPQLDFPYERPLIVGSGNAAATGRILFNDVDAVFADESNYEEMIERTDGAVLISASGAKHAVPIAERLKNSGMDFHLITNNPDAPAKIHIPPAHMHVFPKNKEPYTYNTSTYLGMILGHTHEDPQGIMEFIQNEVAQKIPDNIADYDGYYVMLPARFESTGELLVTKFVELFGRKVARDVFTDEHSKHATTVVPANELFIEVGDVDVHVGDPCLAIPLPDDAKAGAVMAIMYWVIGQIQKGKPDWFKENIASYCERASKIFGQELKPIVD